MQAYAELPDPVDALELTYQVRFPEGFDFVKGGKLPGLYGGTMHSGGDIPNGTNGFSTHYMWRTGEEGEVYAYLPTSEEHGGLQFRTTDELQIEGLFFSTFFGGGDESWASPWTSTPTSPRSRSPEASAPGARGRQRLRRSGHSMTIGTVVERCRTLAGRCRSLPAQPARASAIANPAVSTSVTPRQLSDSSANAKKRERRPSWVRWSSCMALVHAM
jgi:hypothetical protein